MDISNTAQSNPLRIPLRRRANAIILRYFSSKRLARAILVEDGSTRSEGLAASGHENSEQQSRRCVAVSWLDVLQKGPTSLLMLLFLLAPLAVMLGMSFFRSTIFGMESVPSLANYEKLFSDPLYGLLLLKSLRIAMTVTVTVLLISFPVSYWLAKRVTRGKMVLLLLIFAPYWVNYVIRTYAWMPLLGRLGVVNYVLMWCGFIKHPIEELIFNEFSVQLVMVYVLLPFAIVPLFLSLDRIDDNLLRASADLGASATATFRHVLLPLSAPGLAAAAMTVFVLSIGSYVTPRLVGGPSGIMFSNVIADQFGASFNWSWGATLSITLALVTMLLILLVSREVPLAKAFLQS